MHTRIVPAALFLLSTVGPLPAQSIQPTPMTPARGAQPTIRLVQTLRVGSLDGGHDSFGQISAVKLDSRGRIHVADAHNRRITVFGADGSFVGQIGRRGNGPGEFQSPRGLGIGPADTVFVWDAEHARISVFSPDLVYHREFRVPPHWLINSMEILPGGKILIAAFGTGEPGGLQVLSRLGEHERTFGPQMDEVNLRGFESSLLGGTADVSGDAVVYSKKSPYEIITYDLDGTLRSHCVGDRRWTTPPQEVVVPTQQGLHLQWNRYVHSSRILYLGQDLYLNIIHDPVNNTRTLDLVGTDCRLVRRTVLTSPLNVADRLGATLVGVRTLDYPEVIVYTVEIRR